MEALERDQTRSMYDDSSASALAFIIRQNLHVTRRCEEILTAALPLSGGNEERLLEFIRAERGHDRLMQSALDAFPMNAVAPWAKNTHPATILLMDLFRGVAENNFHAFAFAIFLFERPQFEDVHPLTKRLIENGFHEVAKRYEKHHTINETGKHDQIAFEMFAAMPPLTRRAAEQSVRWAEALSRVMTGHSAALRSEIVSSVLQGT